jgi:ABC-type branched-subunit amino acid transport system substrate-binding protein
VISKARAKGRAAGVAVMAVLLVATTLTVASASGAGAQSSVPGFDGSTITVGGFGIKAQLPTLESGAQARFKRFNDTNEIKGVKIKFTEFLDDAQDNATALSDARKLVTEDQVFAIVPNGSGNTPTTYLKQQKMPSFGGGFDVSYCSPKPSTDVWSFGPSGCIVPQDPSFVNDNFHTLYDYVSKQMNKKHPTFLSLGQDNQSGKNATRIFAITAQGTGFDVIGQESDLPLQVSDYSPYVKNIMTADNGKPPDALFCNANTLCLGMWPLLKAQGFKGYFFHGLYSDILVKAFDGSYTNEPYPDFSQTNSPGLNQMKKDIDAYQAGSAAKLDLGDVFGYTAADLFITALQKVAAKGKSNITPANVQKAASTLHWELPGFMKVQYPKATVMQFPSCFSNTKSNGTAWVPINQWSCSNKTYSPNLKVKGG